VPEQPPIGEPIYDNLPAPGTEQPDRIAPEQESSEGEHVVVIPQTAGSAGITHTELTTEES
jgi:hypothetical protein